jgi:hypothetical protein
MQGTSTPSDRCAGVGKLVVVSNNVVDLGTTYDVTLEDECTEKLGL